MKVYSTDVCVPISRLVECISWAENEVKKLDLTAPMVGHVGDGNFHSIILYDPEDKEKQKRIRLYSDCLLYTSPSPRDATLSRMPSSA